MKTYIVSRTQLKVPGFLDLAIADTIGKIRAITEMEFIKEI